MDFLIIEAKLPFNLVKHKLLFPLVEDFPPPLTALKMFLMHYYIAYIRMVYHEFLCQESVTFGEIWFRYTVKLYYS